MRMCPSVPFPCPSTLYSLAFVRTHCPKWHRGPGRKQPCNLLEIFCLLIRISHTEASSVRRLWMLSSLPGWRWWFGVPPEALLLYVLASTPRPSGSMSLLVLPPRIAHCTVIRTDETPRRTLAACRVLHKLPPFFSPLSARHDSLHAPGRSCHGGWSHYSVFINSPHRHEPARW